MRILYVVTVDMTMIFFKDLIGSLLQEGHIVDIACNVENPTGLDYYREKNCKIYSVPFSRSPLNKNNVKAARQLTDIIERGNYDIVHCHTPVASVCTRIVCRKFRKQGLKVFYTAHGFHFYQGAPLKNWLFYYPIETICSKWTDKLITINKEDFVLAQKKFSAKEVFHVPGVGVDLLKFRAEKADRNTKRRELGIPVNAVMLLSVGEVNANKNHQVIVKALAKLNRTNVHYVVAGEGDQKDALLSLAAELGVSEQVHLLGYRTDVEALNQISDMFCFPSIREGLGLAAVEALACGIPVVAAKNRGTSEYMVPGENGFLCAHDDADAFAASIEKMIDDVELRKYFSQKAPASVQRFHVEHVIQRMKEIYGSLS